MVKVSLDLLEGIQRPLVELLCEHKDVFAFYPAEIPGINSGVKASPEY